MPAAPYEVAGTPATGATTANLHDTNLLTNGTCRKLYIGVAGAVKVTMANGDVVTFGALAAGIYDLACKQVWATGTTATGIIALY